MRGAYLCTLFRGKYVENFDSLERLQILVTDLVVGWALCTYLACCSGSFYLSTSGQSNQIDVIEKAIIRLEAPKGWLVDYRPPFLLVGLRAHARGGYTHDNTI